MKNCFSIFQNYFSFIFIFNLLISLGYFIKFLKLKTGDNFLNFFTFLYFKNLHPLPYYRFCFSFSIFFWFVSLFVLLFIFDCNACLTKIRPNGEYSQIVSSLLVLVLLLNSYQLSTLTYINYQKTRQKSSPFLYLSYIERRLVLLCYQVF